MRRALSLATASGIYIISSRLPKFLRGEKTRQHELFYFSSKTDGGTFQTCASPALRGRHRRRESARSTRERQTVTLVPSPGGGARQRRLDYPLAPALASTRAEVFDAHRPPCGFLAASGLGRGACLGRGVGRGVGRGAWRGAWRGGVNGGRSEQEAARRQADACGGLELELGLG